MSRACSLYSIAWCEIRAKIWSSYGETDQGTSGVTWGHCKHVPRAGPQEHTVAKHWISGRHTTGKSIQLSQQCALALPTLHCSLALALGQKGPGRSLLQNKPRFQAAGFPSQFLQTQCLNPEPTPYSQPCTICGLKRPENRMWPWAASERNCKRLYRWHIFPLWVLKPHFLQQSTPLGQDTHTGTMEPDKTWSQGFLLQQLGNTPCSWQGGDGHWAKRKSCLTSSTGCGYYTSTIPYKRDNCQHTPRKDMAGIHIKTVLAPKILDMQSTQGCLNIKIPVQDHGR